MFIFIISLYVHTLNKKIVEIFNLKLFSEG